MINAKNLIEMNNHKRSELTPENEKYYSDFLLYIRLKFFLSEQQSEEVLMEILEHLIEGQNDGKSAKEIFGDDPKEFADEIIQQIPSENKRNIGIFISKISLNLLGLLLMVRGSMLFIMSFFKNVDITFFPLNSIILFVLILSFILLGVFLIFKIIGGSIFNKKQSLLMDSLKVGLSVMILMCFLLLTEKLLPNFGPSIPFTWYASVIIGVITLGIVRLLKTR